MKKKEVLKKLENDEDYYGEFGKKYLSNSDISTLLTNPLLLGQRQPMISAFLIGGYVVQSSWISTVNYLNTQAHYATLTQILARVRSLPVEWSGKTIVVVGSYKMKQDYPYKRATGVATEYMDMRPQHMQQLARLMRDDVTFIPASQSTPGALEYAMTHSAWPHPTSVGVVDGKGVVILSNDNLDQSLQESEANIL